MPRRVEDIIRNDRRSIRDIPIEPREGKGRPPVSKAVTEKTREVPIHRLNVTAPIHAVQTPEPARKRGGGGKWTAIVMLVIAIVGASGYAASAYFSRAKFTIVPVMMAAPVNSTLVATGTSTPGYIAYRTAKLSGIKTASVAATDGPAVSTKASGRATIYNSYSKESQRLIAGTRLSDDAGRIYLLSSSITIPGYTVNSRGTTVPGSVTASITAREAGSQYNKTRSESGVLRIVAYEGGPRYGTMYAELATDLTGGFTGTRKNVSPSLLASTTSNLQKELEAELLAKARAAVPEGSIMYDSAYVVSYSAPTVESAGPDKATIGIEGSLYSILFRSEDLVKKLAGADKVSAFGDFPYKAEGLGSLSFAITNRADFSPSKQNTLIASIKGDMRLVGIIPAEELKQKLAGLSLSETGAVLRSYSPVIDVPQSSGELLPSWTKAVPADIDRISVVVKEG